LKKEESWQVQMNMFVDMDNFQKCTDCKKTITPEEEKEQ